jgi:serine/threonine-protein kinase HipA
MTHNINIFCNSDYVGFLEIDLESNSAKLNYDDNWKQIGFELSPHLKFDKNINISRVKKFISNLLPEGKGLEFISSFFQISKANQFALIEAIGVETAGAITFCSNKNITTSFKEISNDELTQRIKNRSTINITIWDKKTRLSLAGVQDKLPLVVLDDGRYGIGEGKIASTHILKFEKGENINLVLNEYFCMKLAKACGLNTAEVEIKKFDTQNVLFVKRFDRELLINKDGSFEVLKNHIIDACQLLDLDVSMKYEKTYADFRGEANFKNLFESSKLSTNKILTKLHFLRWTLFNLCINNYDAHAKNISFFVNKKGLELTPFYDLVNIAMYPDIQNEFAMGFGDEFNANRIGGFDLVGFCVHTNIQPRLVKNELLNIIKDIKKNIKTIKDSLSNSCNKEEIDFLNSLEKNILKTCEKYKDMIQSLAEDYKEYKDEY